MKAFLDSQWFPDILILVVILLFAFINGKRGFFKCVVPVIILVVSIVGSFILTPYVEPVVQEKLLPFIQEKVAEKIDDTELGTLGDLTEYLGSNGSDSGDASEDSASDATNADSSASASDTAKSASDSAAGSASQELSEADSSLVQSIISALPSGVTELVEKYGVDVSSTIKEKISDIKLGGNVKDQLSSSVAALVSSAAEKAIHTGCYVVVALALLLVLNIIKALINPLIQKTPVVGGINRTLGFIFGAVEAILLIYLVVSVMKLFNIGNILSRADNTVLLRLFMSVDPKGIVSLVSK